MKFDRLVKSFLNEAGQYSGLQKQVNDLMNQDQKYINPIDRINWQKSVVQPFISKNISHILADNKDNGNYPHAPYACWLLVQHMDAFPNIQKWFLAQLEKAIPEFPKLQFLKDRVNVNYKILEFVKNKQFGADQLKNPTEDVRNPNIFKDAGIQANSREEALKNAKEANNVVLYQAVIQTNALTQPSFKG
jgi:hypothetical protein